MSKNAIISSMENARLVSRYHSKWFTDEVFLGILKSKFNLPLSVTKDQMNNILSRHVIDFDCLTIPNKLG